MSEETHFALLSHCWEIYLFLNVTDFIWSLKKKERERIHCLKKKMPWWNISLSLALLLIPQELLLEGVSVPALPPSLIVLGLCLHVSHFWLLLGFSQYPSLHLHLKKNLSLHLHSLFSLGRRQKGDTACGKVTTFKPVNTEGGWENQMHSRSGDAGVEMER